MRGNDCDACNVEERWVELVLFRVAHSSGIGATSLSFVLQLIPMAVEGAAALFHPLIHVTFEGPFVFMDCYPKYDILPKIW